MLIVNLYINRRPIKVVGIHNVGRLDSDIYLYDIYTADDQELLRVGQPLTQIEHHRGDGAEILAAKALLKIKELETN